MINSGQNDATNNTGGWANLDTETECSGGTNANEIKNLVCNTGNLLGQVSYEGTMGTSGGEIQSAFNALRSCWEKYINNPENADAQEWGLMLPVIDCDGNNVSPCSQMKGAVEVNVIWITGNGEDPDYLEVPTGTVPTSTHDTWVAPTDEYGVELGGKMNWVDFADHFNLQNVGSTEKDPIPAPYAKKSIYFLPSCIKHPPEGGTGGTNFGILAKIPVLVH
jgi:hypothetical protein